MAAGSGVAVGPAGAEQANRETANTTSRRRLDGNLILDPF